MAQPIGEVGDAYFFPKTALKNGQVRHAAKAVGPAPCGSLGSPLGPWRTEGHTDLGASTIGKPMRELYQKDVSCRYDLPIKTYSQKTPGATAIPPILILILILNLTLTCIHILEQKIFLWHWTV